MVPNKIPTHSTTVQRIALVGEAPGKTEVEQGIPFVGASGRLLDQLLSVAGIARDACFIGNVCQTQPPDNVLATFNWTGPEIQNGLSRLKEDLVKWQPNIIVCLGATALHAFKCPATEPKKTYRERELRFVFPHSINNWRGSLFLSSLDSPCPETKCIATLHPAYCLRVFEDRPLLLADLRKTLRESTHGELSLPVRDLRCSPTADEVLAFLHSLLDGSTISVDIEGGISGIPCLSIATDPYHSMIIPFYRLDGTDYFTLDEEVHVLTALSTVLANPHIHKIFQNCLYDRFVLQYSFDMPVLGTADDTMVKWWEKYCELPKGLATQSSILTDEPFYKSERQSEQTEDFYRYCCKDSAVTYEICQKLDGLVEDDAVLHYRLNMELTDLLLYMELRGISYNEELAATRLVSVEQHLYTLQYYLDQEAAVADMDKPQLLKLVGEHLCYKKDLSRPKAGRGVDYTTAIRILAKPTFVAADQGRLNTILDRGMNIRSPAFKKFLYETLKVPAHYSRKTGSLTTDYLTLLKINRLQPLQAVTLAAEITELRTRAQTLEIQADPDGRIRCAYNVVGTSTGRVTSYTSPTGSGYNLQTVPGENTFKSLGHPLRDGLRDLIQADPGHWMFQCDLKGADGWTIGTLLQTLGAPEMINDLHFGIKPAARVCYMLRHGNSSLLGHGLSDTKQLLAEVRKQDWDYFACKIGIWGLCYLMGPDLLADQILEESEGRIALSRKEVKDFKQAVFTYYRIGLLHNWMAHHLRRKPELTAASGHTRHFYGRPDEVLGNALSFLPQANTTYATNLAAHRLWTDPENRVSDKTITDSRGIQKRIPLRVEPLHQVHDALLGQFLQTDTTWAINKIKQWFDNPITVAGQTLVIPFEGAYGVSWGDLNTGTI